MMIALRQVGGQGKEIQPMFGLAIHGGAGTLPRADMSPERESEYRAGLAAALAAGFSVLDGGGSSVEAVTRAVAALEDDALFNAGRGAVFTLDGRNELDASIMDGATLAAGAVCGLTRIRNPIELARAVMERSEFVFLSGAGAEEFAASRGFEFVDGDYFHTAARWRQLERIRGGDGGVSPLTISHVGTVGAVALDSSGRLAAATSTGGMTGKRFGRIGDSPIIGAGTYADNRSCAVSATGSGEYFIRLGVAREICNLVRFKGMTIQQAADQVIHHELEDLHGDGGVIALTPDGQSAFSFNTPGMFRARISEGGTMEVGIYSDEK